MHKNSKVFFPGLDGLRFIAFLFVFFSHSISIFIEQHPSGYLLTDRLLSFIFCNGKMGVSIFFVLSGFLITYLILKEIQLFGKLDLRAFYARRFLRIWPLYFAVLLFAFVAFPVYQSFVPGLKDYSDPYYYITFLSNFDVIRLQDAGLFQNLFLTVTWSIAIEEQFYLAWPLLFFFVPLRYCKWVIFAMIAFSFAFMLRNIHHDHVLNFHSFSAVLELAMGGLAAYYSVFSEAFTGFFKGLSGTKRSLIYTAGFLILIFRHELFPFEYGFPFQRAAAALYFAFVILDQCFSPSPRFKIAALVLPGKWGKYTYGLYLLHTIVLLFISKIFIAMEKDPEHFPVVLVYTLAGFLLSLLAAWISYHYYESYFLKKKARFSHIAKE